MRKCSLIGVSPYLKKKNTNGHNEAGGDFDATGPMSDRSNEFPPGCWAFQKNTKFGRGAKIKTHLENDLATAACLSPEMLIWP
jgi:hypothetical protein